MEDRFRSPSSYLTEGSERTGWKSIHGNKRTVSLAKDRRFILSDKRGQRHLKNTNNKKKTLNHILV